MRRLFFSILALSFVGTVIGCCHHIAGICDCEHDMDACQVQAASQGAYHGASVGIPASAPAASLPAPDNKR